MNYKDDVLMQDPNETANQHYVSQVEQCLNALNPNAIQRNQRIYTFTLLNREDYELSLDDPRGRLISTNMSFKDLFSFEVVPGGNSRHNFEALFQQYEAEMKENSLSLLRKLELGKGDLKKEILEIFVGKFMSFLRNPYSVEKVLNTIDIVLPFQPTDPELLAQFNAVLAGRKPQQAHLCAQLGITPDQYRQWLKGLFLMLMRSVPGGPNFMESAVKGIFERPSGFPMVCVYRYTGEHADKRCLISDRGFSNPLPQDLHLAFSFNLCSNAFIVYIFAQIENIQLPFQPPPGVIELYKTLQKNVRVVPFVNDLDALVRYNRNVIYQCHHAVYSSAKQVYGATIKCAATAH